MSETPVLDHMVIDVRDQMREAADRFPTARVPLCCTKFRHSARCACPIPTTKQRTVEGFYALNSLPNASAIGWGEHCAGGRAPLRGDPAPVSARCLSPTTRTTIPASLNGRWSNPPEIARREGLAQ